MAPINDVQHRPAQERQQASGGGMKTYLLLLLRAALIALAWHAGEVGVWTMLLFALAFGAHDLAFARINRVLAALAIVSLANGKRRR